MKTRSILVFGLAALVLLGACAGSGGKKDEAEPAAEGGVEGAEWCQILDSIKSSSELLFD